MRVSVICLTILVAISPHDLQAKKAPQVPLYPCMESLKGKAITITPFETIANVVPIVAPKDQFETTAQYEARKAAAVPQFSNEPIFVRVETVGSNNDLLKYDADRGGFIIDQNALGGSHFNVSQYDLFKTLSSDYRDRYFGAYLKILRKRTGSYKASNTFGTEVEITTIDETDYVIVGGHGRLDFGKSTLLAGADGSATGFLPAPQNTARELSKRLRAAIMFTPMAPYYATGESNGLKPTVRNPYEEHITTKAIIGDMKCSVIYDGADNTVLWAYPTY